jgi:hypothetical protein
MRFPIVLKTPDAAEPEATIYYEVASNGIFQIRDFRTYRAVTRVARAVPGLLPQEEGLELHFPRLPSALLEEVLGFFGTVYHRYRAEAVVIVFYHPDQKSFCVRVPPQTIPLYRDYRGQWRAYLELKYRSVPRPKGFLRLGTIHSHAQMPAYSSFTDCDDERFEDGLHVVFGDLDRSKISRAATFVANGVRFRMDPYRVLESCSVPATPTRADWMAQIQTEKTSSAVTYSGWTSHGSATSGKNDISSTEID